MKKDKIPIQDKQAPSGACSPQQALKLDYGLYEKYLEDTDLTEEQKHEFLDTLWNIIVALLIWALRFSPSSKPPQSHVGKMLKSAS